jgi:hypothetical protein
LASRAKSRRIGYLDRQRLSAIHRNANAYAIGVPEYALVETVIARVRPIAD